MIDYMDNEKVSIDGYVVPHVKADIRPGRYSVTLDDRLGFDFHNLEEFQTALQMLAHGMAIACGNSSFGKHCRPMGKFTEFVGDDSGL